MSAAWHMNRVLGASYRDLADGSLWIMPCSRCDGGPFRLDAHTRGSATTLGWYATVAAARAAGDAWDALRGMRGGE